MKYDFASVCLRLATWLLEQQHRDWARALRAELEYVAETERTRWAFGCLTAAIHQRFVSMQTGSLRISRSVLFLEMILCFLPLTLGWLDAVFGGFGVVHLNSGIVEKYFLDTPLNTSILGMMIGAAVIGCVGPIGLFLTLRAVTTGAGLQNRSLGIVMIAAVAAYAAASLILRLVAGPGAYAADASFILLMIVLPAVGIAHLMYLATPAREDSMQAT
jgi:hypothetical protein